MPEDLPEDLGAEREREPGVREAGVVTSARGFLMTPSGTAGAAEQMA